MDFTLDRPRSRRSLAQLGSHEDLVVEDQEDGRGSRRSGAVATVEGQIADMSSEDNSSSVASKKRREKLRQKKHKRLSPGGYSSGGDFSQQSAFPVPTPDRLGPLSDLMEEEIVLPGESRETSASTRGRGGKKRANWAYLQPPRSPTTSTTSSETSRVRV